MKPEEIAEQLGIEQAVVDRVQTRILATEHKRRMPTIAQAGLSNPGKRF